MSRSRSTRSPRTLLGHVRWYLDPNALGGILAERLLAAIPLGENLYCGVVVTFDDTRQGRMQFWERIDDPEKQGFIPLGEARARALSDVLPRFIEALEARDAAPRLV